MRVCVLALVYDCRCSECSVCVRAHMCMHACREWGVYTCACVKRMRGS